MSTQLFLRDAASDLGGAGQKQLSASRGTTAVPKTTNTTNSGTDIQVTDTAGGQALTWLSPPLASGITISGTVTVNLRGLESAAADNAGGGILVQRAGGAGNVISDIVADTTVPSVITEYSSVAEAAKNGTYTPASTTLSTGDRIMVTVKVRNAGTMAAGTVQNFIDGPAAAGSGDCYVTFTENITLNIPVALAESASAADALAVAAAATLAESGTAADAVPVGGGAVLAEAALAADVMPVTASASLADLASAADALAVVVLAQLAEGVGIASEILAVSVAVPLADAGSASDTLATSYVPPVPASGASAVMQRDSGTAVVTAAATGTSSASARFTSVSSVS